jgi:hypothetical protein
VRAPTLDQYPPDGRCHRPAYRGECGKELHLAPGIPVQWARDGQRPLDKYGCDNTPEHRPYFRMPPDPEGGKPDLRS